VTRWVDDKMQIVDGCCVVGPSQLQSLTALAWIAAHSPPVNDAGTSSASPDIPLHFPLDKKLAKNSHSRKRAVKVLASPNGKGVYAQKPIAKDAVIGQVRGDITLTDDIDPRYLMELDNGYLLRPKAPFRYLNHSCNPNCELFVWEDEDMDPYTNTRPLYVSALRRIATGTQLTIDYAWPADFAIPCHCRSRNCRGWIVDRGELSKLKRQQRQARGS
jgi:hypothetical protein